MVQIRKGQGVRVMSEHIGFPLPSEMFAPPPSENESWDKHVAITKLLDIPLRCPHCEKILKDTK